MPADPALPAVDDRRAAAAGYDFRSVHPLLGFGTASDRYAAWIGQVYPEERWAPEVKTRTKRLGGKSFEERLLPVASVGDYFEHFTVLELDFTFYRPLIEKDGSEGPSLRNLRLYAEHAPDHARFLLKAPQAFAARIVRQGSKGNVSFEENPDYLDAAGYRERFLEPAREALGSRLAGVIFEQEYGRVAETPPPDAFVAELARFFDDVPDAVPTHLEVRSGHLVVPAYTDWLRERGLGLCFSHWTWLPTLREQWRWAGERFTEKHGTAVLRLLNPREMKYAAAFAQAYPFTAPVPALSETPQARQMVNEAAALQHQAVAQGVRLDVIANNRAWGNSPALAQTLAHRFLDFADQKGT